MSIDASGVSFSSSVPIYTPPYTPDVDSQLTEISRVSESELPKGIKSEVRSRFLECIAYSVSVSIKAFQGIRAYGVIVSPMLGANQLRDTNGQRLLDRVVSQVPIETPLDGISKINIFPSGEVVISKLSSQAESEEQEDGSDPSLSPSVHWAISLRGHYPVGGAESDIGNEIKNDIKSWALHTGDSIEDAPACLYSEALTAQKIILIAHELVIAKNDEINELLLGAHRSGHISRHSMEHLVEILVVPTVLNYYLVNGRISDEHIQIGVKAGKEIDDRAERDFTRALSRRNEIEESRIRAEYINQ